MYIVGDHPDCGRGQFEFWVSRQNDIEFSRRPFQCRQGFLCLAFVQLFQSCLRILNCTGGIAQQGLTFFLGLALRLLRTASGALTRSSLG